MKFYELLVGEWGSLGDHFCKCLIQAGSHLSLIILPFFVSSSFFLFIIIIIIIIIFIQATQAQRQKQEAHTRLYFQVLASEASTPKATWSLFYEEMGMGQK